MSVRHYNLSTLVLPCPAMSGHDTSNGATKVPTSLILSRKRAAVDSRQRAMSPPFCKMLDAVVVVMDITIVYDDLPNSHRSDVFPKYSHIVECIQMRPVWIHCQYSALGWPVCPPATAAYTERLLPDKYVLLGV